MNVSIYHYEVLPSTNTVAKEKLSMGEGFGVVLADRQTAGRGRLGRSFFSENGIFMSVMIPAASLHFSPMLLTTAAAKAVCRAICDENFDAGIKWVNDIYVDSKKVSGILAEAVTENGVMRGFVVGIGVNIGAQDFPEELESIAGTLVGDKGLRERIFHNIVENFVEVLTEAPTEIIAYCTEKSIVLGKEIRYFGAKEGFGTAIALDENGGLVVKQKNGESITLTGGEISVRLQ